VRFLLPVARLFHSPDSRFYVHLEPPPLTSKQSHEVAALEKAELGRCTWSGIDVQGASQDLAQAFPLLTNLGNLPCECDFGDLKRKALWGRAVFMRVSGGQTVGVTTANGSLCMLHSSPAPLLAFLQRTERILRSVCDG
jgi:hypothetical protein